MPLSEGNRRSPRQNLLLALSLSGVAGAVNAVGLIEVGELTSHMTGAATHLGVSAAGSNASAVQHALGMLVAFLFGAMTATLFVERARLLGHARYAAALLIEAFALTAFAVTVELGAPHAPWLTALLLWTLCFVMGLQNALVTKISGAVVRTTHVTGIVTDLGIELVTFAFWMRQRLGELSGLTSVVDLVRDLARDPELYKARLHLTILLSFISGAAMGTMLDELVGPLAMVGPVIVVISLVVYDRIMARRHENDDEEVDLEPTPERDRAA